MHRDLSRGQNLLVGNPLASGNQKLAGRKCEGVVSYRCKRAVSSNLRPLEAASSVCQDKRTP